MERTGLHDEAAERRLRHLMLVSSIALIAFVVAVKVVQKKLRELPQPPDPAFAPYEGAPVR